MLVEDCGLLLSLEKCFAQGPVTPNPARCPDAVLEWPWKQPGKLADASTFRPPRVAPSQPRAAQKGADVGIPLAKGREVAEHAKPA